MFRISIFVIIFVTLNNISDFFLLLKWVHFRPTLSCSMCVNWLCVDDSFKPCNYILICKFPSMSRQSSMYTFFAVAVFSSLNKSTQIAIKNDLRFAIAVENGWSEEEEEEKRHTSYNFHAKFIESIEWVERYVMRRFISNYGLPFQLPADIKFVREQTKRSTHIYHNYFRKCETRISVKNGIWNSFGGTTPTTSADEHILNYNVMRQRARYVMRVFLAAEQVITRDLFYIWCSIDFWIRNKNFRMKTFPHNILKS